ncbi:hypothetical protein AB0G02_02085 [Actinosynnema sp. NPDC023658]|uniref:hypothetical protein n=1 Tax=Actinosynnema sp. NPDC023658 TaxID=3155465 RepID=UPI0033C3B440
MGVSAVPCSAIRASRSGSIPVPCSTESTPAATAFAPPVLCWVCTATRPPTACTARTTAVSTSSGTASPAESQSPMTFAQPVRAACAAASAGSSAWSARRPQPSKNWPCCASHGPACQALGVPGSVPNHGGGSSARPGARITVTPASTCCRRWSRSRSWSSGSPGASAPGCVWASTSPGSSHPSATSSAFGTGSVVHRSPSA